MDQNLRLKPHLTACCYYVFVMQFRKVWGYSELSLLAGCSAKRTDSTLLYEKCGRAPIDYRHVLSSIIFITLNGFQWCYTPAKYGSSKILSYR